MPQNHLLYPKKPTEQNTNTININEDSVKKTENLTESKSQGFEAIKTLLTSLIFFLFFIVLATGIIFIKNAYYQTPEDNILSTNANAVQINNFNRIKELKNLKEALENFYIKNHKYPEAKNLTKILLEEKFITKIPVDPVDKEPFKFVYAVYDNSIGNNQSYIISTYLEDKNGNATVWTVGSPESYHPDFRDLKKSNIAYIENNSFEVNKPKVKVEK